MTNFVSLDVEGTGTTPGNHSVLSVGLVPVRMNAEGFWVCEEDKKYSRNLHRRHPIGAECENAYNPLNSDVIGGPDFDPETLTWWETQPEAWRLCRIEPTPPRQVAAEICAWALQHDLWDATLIAWPTAYDIPHFRSIFVDADSPPFGYSGYCLSTAKRLLKALGKPHKFDVRSDDLTPHVAVHDAIFQGRLAAALFNSLPLDP